MYYTRVLTTAEELYVSRAKQRIAELTYSMASEMKVNNVTYKNSQIIVELEYTIEVLYSTFLDWTRSEIDEMMDFYTIRANLAIYGLREIDFNSVCSIADNGAGNWATVEQLSEVDTASKDRDTALEARLNAAIDNVILAYQAADLAIINSIPDLELENSIVAEKDLGGIAEDTNFPPGTTFEEMWNSLLGVLPEVEDLTLTPYSELIEVGQTVNIVNFSWTNKGVPENLLLSDDAGILTNQAVTDEQYVPIPSLAYLFDTLKTIGWTLDGSNTKPTTKSIRSVYKSYYGKKSTTNDNPITVTETDILNSGVNPSYNKLAITEEEIEFTADTTSSEMGWIAVHKAQSGAAFTKWFVDDFNQANIGSEEFILSPVDVTVNGEVYSVYRWGYRSPLSLTIKLHR